MKKPFRKTFISPETLFISAILVVANSVLLFQVAFMQDAWWLKATTIAGMVSFIGMVFVGRSPSLSRIGFNILLNLTLFSFFGWGFSHVGNLLVLPFAVAKWLNLGLYYFLLFGLLMGAGLRSLLHSLGIESKMAAIGTGAIVAVLCWMSALSLEARYVPGDAYAHTAEAIRRLPPGVKVADLHRMVNEQAREQLGAFAPGGTLGYMRWAYNDGLIKANIPGHGETITYIMRQRGHSFAIRVMLSVVLLILGICYMAARRRSTKRPRPMFPEADECTVGDNGLPPHSHSMVAGGLDEMS